MPPVHALLCLSSPGHHLSSAAPLRSPKPHYRAQRWTPSPSARHHSSHFRSMRLQKILDTDRMHHNLGMLQALHMLPWLQTPVVEWIASPFGGQSAALHSQGGHCTTTRTPWRTESSGDPACHSICSAGARCADSYQACWLSLLCFRTLSRVAQHQMWWLLHLSRNV